jgi:hypothetical protein
MPYGATSELPAYVKKLPAASQRQWMHVFNSCLKNGGDEARCFRMANGVAKKDVSDFEPEGEYVTDEYDIALFEKAFPFVDTTDEPAIVIGEGWLDEEKLRRAEMDEASFAYIDPKGNRKLPIHTAGHVRNALARFNQTQFDSAQSRRRAYARIVRAARKFGIEVSDDRSKSAVTRLAELFGLSTPEPPGSALQAGVTALPETEGVFGVIKQANGKLRWFARYSNAWEDRDHEILTEEAHKDYIKWAYDSGTFPELWLWHTGGTRFGEADWLDFSDGFAHASGLIDDGKESVVASLSGKDIGVSHGFLSLQQGKYVSRYRTYEISVLPREYAAVETSGFNILDAAKESEIMAFTPERRKWLVDTLGEDAVKGLEKSTESMAAQLKELGVEYKEADDAEKADDAAQSEGFKTLSEQVVGLTAAVSQLTGIVAGQQKELASVKTQQTKTDDEKIEDAFLARVAKAFGQNSGVTRPTESAANVEGATKEATPAQADFFSTMVAEQFGYAAKNNQSVAGTVGTEAVAAVNVDASSAGPTEVRG